MLSKINNLQHQRSGNFFLIAGPCVIESEKIAMEIAEKTLNICNKLEIPFIFKGSYRKANRSRIDSFTGIGDKEALSILKKVGEKFNIPTLTDIHSEEEASIAAQYVDVLQIPAFLCRQTDLLVAAARTGKIVNIKKGQFLSPKSMEHAVTKVKESGNNTIMITDRGTMFGYQDIVVDFRGIPTMKQFGVPVVMDITHSLQQPNQDSGITGGNPKMIEIISKAAIATGVDGIFLETHPNPSKAKSDGSNMLELDKLEELLVKLVKIRKVI
ncbi:MAG: 3-deoxy-8-phosphooctulonate synthase [Flavobacteriales bacterium]|nr:3-deoxy-8-phosphooctulonate synthase [Flavobacteriales bacterium]